MKHVLLLLLLATSNVVVAHEGPPIPKPMDLNSLTKAFGWDLDSAEITSEKVADNLYVLFGVGGNIAVSIGADGVLIVDDQFPQLMPKIRSAISKLGGSDINFAVNTHWHFDHAEGNIALGAEGTWLVSQENSRQMMLGEHIINLVGVAYEQKAYPESALPDITFAREMQFHLNGQQIELWHFGPAHTTGDAAVYFRKANVVHLGDVFNKSGYPFIDAGNGGTLDGVIAFCEATLTRINKDTVVVPGHGKVSNYEGLKNYIEMLKTVREKMLELIDTGASLNEVIAAQPTKQFDQKVGADPQLFINRAYMSLTHRRPN